jgi:hypothetical protein
MAWTVTLLSPVLGDGENTPYRPKLSDDFPGLTSTDVTHRDTADQPGDPSLVVIEVVTDDPDIVSGNDDYFVLDSAEMEQEDAENPVREG